MSRSLESCFNGKAFCWNQKPEELFCYICQPKKGFPKGDSLYKYNNVLKKWEIACDGNGTCDPDCLVHAYQKKDPVFINRVYYNVVEIQAHLKHHIRIKELMRDTCRK